MPNGAHVFAGRPPIEISGGPSHCAVALTTNRLRAEIMIWWQREGAGFCRFVLRGLASVGIWLVTCAGIDIANPLSTLRRAELGRDKNAS